MKFTQREYELLIYLLELGNWVVDPNADQDDSDLEPIEMITQKVMQMAMDDGYSDLVKRDGNSWLPSKTLDAAAGEAIAECMEDTFWPGLARRMALRDLERELGGFPEAPNEEQMDRWMTLESGWQDEFGEFGIERLKVDARLPTPLHTPVSHREIFELKIHLLGIDPPIWRRVKVPSNICLDDLHEVIQIVMGWEDSHLYSFASNGRMYAEADELGWRECGSLETPLLGLMAREGDVMQYDYDFGDGWEHRVALFKVHEWDDDAPLPICTGGRRACPP